MKDAEAFTKNNWGNKSETLSGSGSTIANTVNIRRELPLLVQRWNIGSIFDAPCGDGNWISTIRDQLNCEYSGGDLVEPFWQSAASKGLNVLLHLIYVKHLFLLQTYGYVEHVYIIYRLQT